jgi:hypothetical protein
MEKWHLVQLFKNMRSEGGRIVADKDGYSLVLHIREKSKVEVIQSLEAVIQHIQDGDKEGGDKRYEGRPYTHPELCAYASGIVSRVKGIRLIRWTIEPWEEGFFMVVYVLMPGYEWVHQFIPGDEESRKPYIERFCYWFEHGRVPPSFCSIY